MVSQIIEFLTVNESKMEFQNKDFDKDRSVQYKETTRELTKHDDLSGPAWLPYRDKSKKLRQKRSFDKYILKKKMKRLEKALLKLKKKSKKLSRTFPKQQRQVQVLAVEKLI